MKINEDHVYKCQWASDDNNYVFFNYIASVCKDSGTFTGDAIAGTCKDYAYLSKQVMLSMKNLYHWNIEDVEKTIIFEDTGTYEEFVNNYPELLI